MLQYHPDASCMEYLPTFGLEYLKIMAIMDKYGSYFPCIEHLGYISM